MRSASAEQCRVCGFDFAAAWSRASLVAQRIDLTHQMDWGVCFPCQRQQYAAAVEYERACFEAAMFGRMGANESRHRQVHPAMRQAMYRIEQANARCVALKMWPANRAG